MERYSVIKEKNPREIVLLRGSGCKWRRCTFCDYHLDFSQNKEENFRLNSKVLSNVKGIYKRLEVINSGSFCDLDEMTMDKILEVCKDREITTIHFECHYLHRDEVPAIKERFSKENITVKIKSGVETFDIPYREEVMKKGFCDASPEDIANYADEVCLLFGLKDQTEKSMTTDIETGLKYFERVCVNIMNENTTPVKPDKEVIEIFAKNIAPKYIDNNRVDILMNNTDFGVGAENEGEENYCD
ncbi:MAG: radical SAM protein [Ruminococcus sp.]|nr:radical SAM protein [Ruminococcus sp.]